MVYSFDKVVAALYEFICLPVLLLVSAHLLPRHREKQRPDPLHFVIKLVELVLQAQDLFVSGLGWRWVRIKSLRGLNGLLEEEFLSEHIDVVAFQYVPHSLLRSWSRHLIHCLSLTIPRRRSLLRPNPIPRLLSRFLSNVQ